jgi:hypothetical protein
MTDEKLVQNDAVEEPQNDKNNKAHTLTGKIARLPRAVREKLNHRLDNGQPGSHVLPWLNGLPVVKRVLAAWFAGAPINDQNLSNWRATGYQQWLEKQEFVSELKTLAEDASDFTHAAGEKLARATASLAAAKILKMLHAMRPQDCDPAQLIKIAYATTALVHAEQNNERLINEKTRVYQGNERIILSWDKHLRGCVDTAQRAMNDQFARDIQSSDIDNSEKIELLGHHLFSGKWHGRKVPEPETEPRALASGLIDPSPAPAPSPVPEPTQADAVGGTARASCAAASDTLSQRERAGVRESRPDHNAVPVQGEVRVPASSPSEPPVTDTNSTRAAQASTEPEYSLREIEWLLRQGKTLEEARRVLDARRRGIKEPAPANDVPNPGPTPPFYGPCEPPLTRSSAYNFGPPPGRNSLG